MELYLRHLQPIHRALDPLLMKLHHQISGIQAVSSLRLYQYKTTNPPHRPYSQLPINSRRRNDFLAEIILGFELALSSDGSILAVGGFDFVRDFGFVKVYKVSELFYVDCIVEDEIQLSIHFWKTYVSMVLCELTLVLDV